jgi:hypothetical protein
MKFIVCELHYNNPVKKRDYLGGPYNTPSKTLGYELRR